MWLVQLDCVKVHTGSCEFLDNVRLCYIKSTETLIWDPAKFSHTLFLSDRWGLRPRQAKIWLEANIQYEPVGEEMLNNSNNDNNNNNKSALYFSLNHFPPPPVTFLSLRCLDLSSVQFIYLFSYFSSDLSLHISMGF